MTTKKNKSLLPIGFNFRHKTRDDVEGHRIVHAGISLDGAYDLIMSNRANEISDKKLSELSEETGALRIEYIQEGAPSFIVKVCQDYQDMILAEISARKIGYSSYIGKSCKNTIQ